MGNLWQDVRYGIRMMLKRPGFTAIAVLALAVGIGANSAIFSVINAVLLRPLPYQNGDRLVLIWEKFTSQGLDRIPVSAPEFTEYREQNHVFEQVAAFDTNDFNLTGGETPERIPGATVSASLFSVLGVQPERGRTFLPEDNELGHDNVVLLGHGLWERRFGSDPNMIGKTIALNGRSYTVVGIMPPSFNFPLSLFDVQGVHFTQPAEVWTALAFTAAEMKARGSRELGVVGLLKMGVSPAQASAEVQNIAAGMMRQHPDSYPPEGWGAMAVSLQEQVVGRMRPMLLVLFAAVGLVLLIACANVANLMLARAAARQKEIAIRRAMGAGRLRLIRQLLTESILLSLLGGILGLLLALWGLDLLVSLGAETLPRLKEISLDGRVLGFTTFISVLTGALFGLAPALQASKLELAETLKEGGRSSSAASGNTRLRSLTVMAEFALSLMLLIAAGLAIKSFWRLANADPGFSPQNVLTLELSLPKASYATGRSVAAFYKQALERIRALPGVTAAGAATVLPLSGSNSDSSFVIEGKMPQSLTTFPDEEYRVVTPDYFRTMNIPLIKGRFFDEADHDQAPGAVIINQALARKYFAGEEPLGRRLTMDDPSNPAASWVTVVGIVGDIKHRGLNTEAKPELYVTHAQNPERSMTLVARTASSPSAVASAVRREIASLDKDLPVYNTRTMDQVISDSVAQQRLSTFLLGLFAALALTLTTVGIYGVISYTVAQRTHEIGVRMALGAQARDVLRLVVGQGMVMVLIGVGLGLAAAFGLTRLMSSLLYGVSATDPMIFVIVSLGLSLVALIACYVPARRATRVDPMTALRYE
jgi:predicted permease